MHNTILKKSLLILLLALVVTALGSVSSYADDTLYETLQRDGKLRLIVRFKDFIADRISFKLANRDLVSDNEINEYILKKIDQKYNLKKLKKLITDNEMSGGGDASARVLDAYYVIEVDRSENYAEYICSRLERFSEIEMVEQDIKVSIAATQLPDVSYIPNDQYVTSDSVNWRQGAWGQSYPDLWGLQKTKALEAWGLFNNVRTDPGKDIVVAVIDTGVDFSHPDINANRWINPEEIAGNGVDDDGNGYIDDINGWDFVNSDNNPYDGHGHGTHCSGSIAGVTNNSIGVAGVAPNTRIMAVKGLSDSGSGYISGLSNCIIYAADNGAHVLSNSWGGWGSSSTLTSAVNYAHSKGCVIIAAAGNSNADAASFLPANIPNAIAVAATDYNDVKAYFSNYGTIVDISAPGVSILSTTGSGYASWSGTSMACPHVSGVAALILSHDPTITNTGLRQRLKDTADDISSANPSYQGLLGAGRLNAYAAILAGGPIAHAPVLEAIGNKSVDEGGELRFTLSASDEDGDDLIYSVVDLPGGLETSGDADFFIQSDTVYEGSHAIRSGSISKGESSTVTKRINLAADGEISFYWKVSSHNSDKLAFYIDSTKQAEISGEVDWHKKSYSVTRGTCTLTWVYSKQSTDGSGDDAGFIDMISIAYGADDTYDFEDGQMPDGFATGGDSIFAIQANEEQAHSGIYSLMSDASIGDNQSIYVQKMITAIEGAQLSFWWRVSSEYYYDFLEFYIDGALQDQISGNTNWANKTYNLSAGTHILKWRYSKDYSVTHYLDKGWIDDIVFDNGGEQIVDFELDDGEGAPLPGGASFDTETQTFTWTPGYEQSGTYENIRFIVTEETDAARTDYEDITITVNDVSFPPELDAIGDKVVSEMELLEFAIAATNPEGDELVYSASGLPVGASFNADTRTFSWIPTYQQSGTYENVHFEVAEGNASGEGNSGYAIDENTKLLMQFNTEDGSTNIVDSSPGAHAFSPSGGARLDESVKRFGTASLNLNSSTDFIYSAASSDWDICRNANDDWTVDLWVKHTADMATDNMMYVYNKGSNNSWFLYRGNSGTIVFTLYSSNGVVLQAGSSPNTISDTDWHHVALCKVADRYGIYVDGAQVAYVQSSATMSVTGSLYMGWNPRGFWNMNGYLDEVRIYQGNTLNASPDSAGTDSISTPSR